MGTEPIWDCMGCDFCHNGGNSRCVHEDMVNDWLEKAAEADGFVFGSPVYYAHPTGQFLSLPPLKQPIGRTLSGKEE